MLLALDIGNTNITVGVFQGETLKATWRMATDARRMPDEYGIFLRSLLALKGISAQEVRDVALCSVVPPLTTVFEELSRTYFDTTPLVIGTGVKTGVRVLYDAPRDVGADRIVDAAAAFLLYGGPVIVVDLGTATVLDAVTQEGDYLGGAIAPGLNLAAESLFLGTSQLRRVELVRPKTAIGRNTIASLQSGLIFGHVAMIEGLVRRFKGELGENSKVVATGGLANLIARETNIFNAVNLELTLIGLRVIHEMNQKA